MMKSVQIMKYGVLVMLLGIAAPQLMLAQASQEFMKLSTPSPSTHVEILRYTNSFDGSTGEAMLEIPASSPSDKQHRMPLILTSNPAGWTQAANRCLWTGIADKFHMMILYPRGQDSLEPNASLGAPRQIATLQAALLETEKLYPVDTNRISAAGLSQGALEALLMAAKHPG
jgi:poly(3-hydroxybutyrate) depolymerase